MIQPQPSRMESAFLDFWSRDYVADVRDMNRQVGRRGGSAGFEEVPPSVLTGNPFTLSPGGCVAVIGLNPKWQAGGWAAPRAKFDIIPARTEHAAGDWLGYRQRRARFFDAGDPQYYGRYFTKLGNRLSEVFSPHTPQDARAFFRRKIVKLDLLPWFSSDLKGVDPARLNSAIPALEAWKHVVQTALLTLKPVAIVINGSGFRELVEAFFAVRLDRFTIGNGQKPAYAYSAMVGEARTPLLVHAQLNAQGAPASGTAYAALFREWSERHHPGATFAI